MSDTYTKVFRTMYTGSLYGAGVYVFAVWGWILAHKDENGCLEVNPQLVANELGGVAEHVEGAIKYLCAPDPNSRTPAEEGRRLIKVSQFGYRVVNHDVYNDRGKSRSAYWRAWRAKKEGSEEQQRNSCATPAQQRNSCAPQSATPVDVDVDVDVDSNVKSGKREFNQSDKSEQHIHRPPDAAPLDFPDSTRLGYRQELRDVLRIGACPKLKDPASANRGLDSFERWLHRHVTSGRFGPDCYARAMEIAKDCVKSDVPYAAFMGRTQREMHYVPPTRK